MEDKKEMKQGRGMGFGHGPGGPKGGSKEKIPKGTWSKLINYSKKYWIVVIFAIICAMCGSTLTLLGPDKLSDITDAVTDGIAPKTDKLEDITKAISDNISTNMKTVTSEVSGNASENMKTVMAAIAGNMASQNGMAPSDIKVNDVTISVADQMSTLQLFNGVNMEDSEAVAKVMAQLPDSVISAMYTEIKVNGSTISGADQQSIMDSLSKLNMDSSDSKDAKSNKATMKAMNNLPDSVKDALYTSIKVDNAAISGKDQIKMMDTLSKIDKDNTDATLKAFDKLPKSVYKLVKPSIDMEKVAKIGFFLVTIYLIGAALSAVQGWIMSTVTQRISKKLRTDVSTKINRLPMGYYHHHSTGDVLSRVTNDIDLISMSLNMSIGTLVSAITLFVGSLVMMIKTDLIMTGAGVLATVIGFVLMFVIMGRSQKYFTRQQKDLGALNGHIEEIYSGHTVVKAYNGEERASKDFKKLNNKLRDSGFKAQALSGLMMPIMTFIGNFGYVVVCVVGALLVLNDKISFGVIVSFMIYIRFFTQPLAQIAQASQQLQSAGAASSRVFEFLEAEEMEDESDKTGTLTNTKGDVSFSHVRFGYNPDKVIIKDFSAEAKAGQKIAIVGPTGAGKSTLVNLLMRFYEINSGDIKIDGVSTSTMKRETVHSQFCMVLQDTWLFEGTVRENLIYDSLNKSDEKMKEACKSVGLDHFIRTLPNGYDTVLNDEVNLSQGQKQQLTIARAMIADKPILILDEATSSIDTKTELKIQEAMDELMKGRTSFVIAHRLSTIKNADLILVLKDGDVIESGTHNELLDKKGFYADLYNSQFDDEAV